MPSALHLHRLGLWKIRDPRPQTLLAEPPVWQMGNWGPAEAETQGWLASLPLSGNDVHLERLCCDWEAAETHWRDARGHHQGWRDAGNGPRWLPSGSWTCQARSGLELKFPLPKKCPFLFLYPSNQSFRRPVLAPVSKCPLSPCPGLLLRFLQSLLTLSGAIISVSVFSSQMWVPWGELCLIHLCPGFHRGAPWVTVAEVSKPTFFPHTPILREWVLNRWRLLGQTAERPVPEIPGPHPGGRGKFQEHLCQVSASGCSTPHCTPVAVSSQLIHHTCAQVYSLSGWDTWRPIGLMFNLDVYSAHF